MINKNTVKILLIFLLISSIFFLTRLIRLTADPAYISWSHGAYTDIGYYIANARNAVLFGAPEAGDWDNRILFPVYHYIMLGWFKLTNVSFFSVNLAAVIISFFTLYFLTALSKNFKFKIFISLLFSLNFISITTNRIAYLENFSVFFLAVAAAFIKNGGLKKTITGILCITAAILTKSTAFFFLPLCVIYWIILYFKKQINLSKLLTRLFLAAAAVIFIYWYYYFARKSFNDAILHYTIFNKSAVNITDFPKILFNAFNTNFFGRIPIISLCAGLYTLFLIFKRRLGNTDIIAVLWILAIIAQFTFFRYNPLRYYLFLLPPLIIFAARFLNDYNNIITVFDKSMNLINIIFCAPVFYFGAYNFLWVLHRSLLDKHIHPNILFIYSLYLTLLLLFLFPVAIKLLKNNFISKCVFLLIIFLFLFECGFQFYKYHFNQTTYDLIKAAADIQKRIKPDNTLAGWFAPQLGMNTNIKTLPSYNMSADYLRANKVSHLILQQYSVSDKFDEFNLKYLNDYYIQKLKIKLVLYEIIN